MGFSEAVYGAYGMDQELVNGSQYYNRHLQASGHPYFMGDTYLSGSVLIDGRLYTDLWLKYDVYYQQLLLSYITFSGAPNQIILVNEHVERFTLGDIGFVKRKGPRGIGFYQEIETAPFTCYVFWQKRLDPSKQQAGITEQFSDARRHYSILIDGEEQVLSGKKSFYRCFDPALHKDLKRVMRDRGFSFRRSLPGVIGRTMEELAEVVEKGGGL